MKKRNTFYKKFNIKEVDIIKEYFNNLNNNISLTKKETIKLNEDFEKAIDYYLKQGKNLKETLKILSIDNLGDIYQKEPENWYPLDNAAKIYPLSMRENWMNVYRVSCYLKEDIVPEIFQIALLFTMKRFPTFRTSIRKGFFWHYIDGIKKRFHVYEDKKLPCSYINVSNIGKQSFKAVYYKNRISIEYFHILADGTSATIFLSTLVATYLKLLGKEISTNDTVLDIKEKPKEEESKDEFKDKTTNVKSQSLIEGKAVQIDGKSSNIRPCQILHFDLDLKDIKELSKNKDATITEIILSLLFISISYSTSKEGLIKIQVPVNMRKYYPSKTLRNFSLYVTINIPREEITDLDSVLIEVKRQLYEKNNIDNLNGILEYTNKLIKYLRLIPLFIKKPVAKIIYGYAGDKSFTTVLSNLGNINLPNNMQKEVEKMDFVLGTTITNKLLFSIITCNNILTLSISKYTLNTSVENNLYNLLIQNNIKVKVYGSENYDNKK